MTTDVDQASNPRGRNIARKLTVLVGLVLGWFATMATAVLIMEKPSAVMVIVPSIQTLRSLGDDIRLVSGGESVLVMTSAKRGYVWRLYKSGAWLVLPSLRNGCLVLNAAKNPVRSR